MGRSIEVDSITHSFADRTILSRVSFRVADGELVALVGPSGCGKTTLLRIIAGLERPQEGRVFMDGMEVTHVAPANRGIGMAFQQFALYPKQTVERNLSVPLEAQGYDRTEVKRKVLELSDRLAVSQLLKRSVDSLSGGEQQRVALGRAIIKEPSILLLDEPLASVDAALQRTLRELILSLHEELGTTTVYVTHDVRETGSIADRVIVLEHGMIRQEGTIAELILDPSTLFIVQHASELPMNLGDGVLMSRSGGGWLVRLGDFDLPVVWTGCGPEPSEGRVEFALHPDHVRLVRGGAGRIERKLREGGRDLLRVIVDKKVWWLGGEGFEVGNGGNMNASVDADFRRALFFNEAGERLRFAISDGPAEDGKEWEILGSGL